MMNVFCSYAFTGEDELQLTERMTAIRDLFRELKIEYYINLFAPDYQNLIDRNANAGEFVRVAIADMKQYDIVFVIVTSDRRSEGMLMEVGAAIATGKKIVLAQQVSSIDTTYLPTVAADTFTWHSDDDLLQQTKNYFQKNS